MGKVLILRGYSSNVKVLSEWDLPEYLVSLKVRLNILIEPR